MIVGLGIDLVELARIKRVLERFGEAFAEKIFHESERALLPAAQGKLVSYVAARFAAKEAGVKALGTGFTGGIGLHDVRVHSLASGKPEISFHGKARERAEFLGVRAAHLSLTHARDSAAAVVVLEDNVDHRQDAS